MAVSSDSLTTAMCGLLSSSATLPGIMYADVTRGTGCGWVCCGEVTADAWGVGNPADSGSNILEKFLFQHCAEIRRILRKKVTTTKCFSLPIAAAVEFLWTL